MPTCMDYNRNNRIELQFINQYIFPVIQFQLTFDSGEQNQCTHKQKCIVYYHVIYYNYTIFKLN
jgi:hypothetical protein